MLFCILGLVTFLILTLEQVKGKNQLFVHLSVYSIHYFKKRILFYLICMDIFAYMYVSGSCAFRAHRGQERALDSMKPK